ncbi:hypothetical protein FA048_11135 [Pedobacter polaris]|uniref:Lipoprotein n=1 Tax=Pedobacter polaris TaxID=2571273 RepID=A0A4U1CRE6_9SPHI|nr:hypothetical protein [Pedobacter polaris]TKC10717.1 hypothetical protein FA048_11135 [Pedobacter polaris]
MTQGKKFLMMAMALPLLVTGCELFEAEPEEETKKVDNTTYTYSYTCATGKKNTIQIPNRLSSSCKANWEYYARTYGCNDANNFAEAEKRKGQCP